MDIKILYEDENVLVIDKPTGFSVHPDGRNTERTVTDWVLDNYPKLEDVGEPMGDIKRPGVVHRLDKETSGVLILAKNQEAYRILKDQFKNRQIKKRYHCVVNGWVKQDSGVVDKPIGRSPRDFRRRLAGRGARGELREALTRYKVLKRFEDGGNKFTYLEIEPKTGRTHQIRVHMKFLNHPLVCDYLYNPSKPKPSGFDHLALHAKYIEFKKPGSGEVVRVESEPPEIFRKILGNK